MSARTKQKKQLKVAETSASYLVETQENRHSGGSREPLNSSAGWRTARLGEILPIKYGKARTEQFGYPRPQTATFGSNGAFGTFDRALTEKPAIIVGRKGAAGAVHYSSEPCWPIDTAFYTEGSEGIFLPFFRYLLDTLQLVRLDRSTAIPSLSRDDYDAKEVRYPEAPDEQRLIVAEIEKQFTRLDAGIAALRRVQANLKRYRAAILKAACEGSLVPTEAELARKEGRAHEPADKLLARVLTERRQNWQGRSLYKEPAPPHTTQLPPLPQGWTWASVEQLSTRVQYGSSAKTNENSSGIPVLRMGNIQDGKFDFDKLKYLPKAHDEFPELLLARGDLLFNRTNSAELVGKTAVYKGTPHLCSFASYLIRAQFGDGCVPDFVSYFINSVFGRAWIAGVVSQQVGQANVNGTKLQALAIPLPPLAEQTRIVAEVERQLSVVEEQEAVVSANLQRATRLQQSILSAAFGTA